jgi:hypothetical protein
LTTGKYHATGKRAHEKGPFDAFSASFFGKPCACGLPKVKVPIKVGGYAIAVCSDLVRLVRTFFQLPVWLIGD